MYSERLLEHFQNPHNVGELDDADIRAEVSNPICGDILRLTAAVAAGRIERIAYQARGCTASIAAGSALTELLLGTTAEEASRLSRDDVEEAVGGLSNESKHAAVLAIDGVKALLRGWPS
ncbi:MAG: iron-sulfur cluster assembly scaffold protein [Acidobacteria bacterium]|nr:iron-sulfur cluster assembly scaffold protein [Acidobacteriota bacterium]